MTIAILPLPAFNDNYIWLIQTDNNRNCLVVDPGDADVVLDYIQNHQLTLNTILITHHHHDHIGGLERLCDYFPKASIIGPDDNRIPFRTLTVKDNETLHFDEWGLQLTVIATPGHTLSHVCYYDAVNNLLFCGDTLFSAGCGRLFEGSADDMYHSLQRLSALPPETAVYCAHEYTRKNLAFAATIEPKNQAIIDYQAMLNHQAISLPSNIALEKKVNPFLRCHTDPLAQVATDTGLPKNNPVAIFSHIRQLKDSF